MKYVLKKDGQFVYENEDINEVYMKLQRVQGHSASWAIKYNGYQIFEVDEKGNEKDISNL